MLERAARQTESPTEGALLVVADAVHAAADAASDLAGDLVADTASALEAGTALVAIDLLTPENERPQGVVIQEVFGSLAGGASHACKPPVRAVTP